MTHAPAAAETAVPETTVDAVVVGAGFSGLYMTLRLLRQNLTVQGFEAADGPGGTWYWNRYPGARTDSQAHIYCYTFDKELRDSWDWQEKYPGQREVLSYLEHVADRFDLRRHYRFGERVASATYDEERNVWVVETDAGTRVTATYLVSAVGVLSAVNWPAIEGLQDFEGRLLHTARWPHEPVDLSGTRVGVIGAGSSGVQLLPHLAEVAEQVTMFQRTPNYVAPSGNRPLTDEDRAHVRTNHDEIHRKIRSHPYSHPYEAVGPSAKAAPEGERRRVFEEAWDAGGFALLMATYDDLVIDAESNELVAEFIREKIRATVSDPALAETLAPRTYPYAVKRPPSGVNYYETFNCDNVEVVDVLAHPIERVTARGVVVDGREHHIDVLVLATGFDASTGGILAMDVRGRDGRRLADAWSDGPWTYLGMGTPGFPNFFTVLGPQQPFANIPTCVEADVDWIAGAIEHSRARGVQTFEASPEAADAWTRETEEIGNMTLARFGTEVGSWMNGANIDGKPRRFMFYFGGANNFFDRCQAVADNGYEGFALHVNATAMSGSPA